MTDAVAAARRMRFLQGGSSRSRAVKPIGIVLACLLAASLPLWIGAGDYRTGVLVQMTIIVAYGLSWHLLAGYCGQYSFGHAIFFGIGAYTTAILSAQHNVSPWFGLFAGGAAAAVGGLIVGLITLRLSGLFFGLVTFGAALILTTLASHFASLTGGAAGISLPLRPGRPGMMQFDSAEPLFFIGLGLVVAYLAVTAWLLRCKSGKRFIAVRDDQVATEAAGIATRSTRIQALCISAAMAGVVGGLYAQSLLFIDPNSAFGIDQSVNAIFPAIIGGMGTFLGPVLGGIILVLLREIGNTYSQGNGAYSVIFYSSIVFVLLLVAPGGLLGIGRAVTRRLPWRRAGAEDDG